MSEGGPRRMLACNLDRRGRGARAVVGMLMIALGAALFLAGPLEGWLKIAASGALGAFGAFALFEAANGWCAVRAMGFKTWI